jgi:hypothetical protein
MSANRKKQVVLLLLVVVIAGLLSIFGTAAADLPDTLPPPEELAIEWWKWATDQPAHQFHPLIKSGRLDCGMGREGDVWFLGGSFGPTDKATRVCDVPADTYLFFPIVNIICSPLANDPDDPDFLLECAVNPGDVYGFDLEMYPVSASVDGVEIPNLYDSYVVPGKTFWLGPVPDPNIFGAEEGAEALAATTGYYLLLPPLPEGKHTLNFVGEIAGDYPSHYDITYILFVE